MNSTAKSKDPVNTMPWHFLAQSTSPHMTLDVDPNTSSVEMGATNATWCTRLWPHISSLLFRQLGLARSIMASHSTQFGIPRSCISQKHLLLGTAWDKTRPTGRDGLARKASVDGITRNDLPERSTPDHAERVVNACVANQMTLSQRNLRSAKFCKYSTSLPALAKSPNCLLSCIAIASLL